MKEILLKLIEGKISVGEAESEINLLKIKELGNHVKFDADRESRLGVSEAVYSQGKSDNDLLNIINNIDFVKNLMITRLDKSRYNRIKNQINE